MIDKECPLCGERMRLELRETTARIPGSPQEVRTVIHEWVCRECDYFEEADEQIDNQ
jgi:C4-type Zn-finger protein